MTQTNKLLFLIFHDIDKGNGVSNKIQAQINAFKYNGYDVDFSYMVKEGRFLKKRFYNDALIDEAKDSYYAKKYSYKYRYNNLFNKIIEENINLVYIRYTHFANPFFTRFLSKLKKKNIKVLLEIPTYPYDHEYKYATLKQKIFLKVEQLSRQKFKKYCHRIITLSEDKKIFGTDTVIITNGIELDKIKQKKKQLQKDPKSYRLVGLANLRFWHGYDRLIKGLHDYYANTDPQIKIYFDIIGDSENKESKEYKAMVKAYGLEEYVLFHGVLNANELDVYFDNAAIAVGCLGVHRKGLKEAKTLKNREYCARGIPFMYSEIDRDFENLDFVLKVPDNESNIEVNTIINFLETNTFSIETERAYAEKNLTWNVIVKKLISKL